MGQNPPVVRAARPDGAPVSVDPKKMSSRNPSKDESDWEPSGFFVCRSPLLPFDELLAWSQDLEAPQALDDSARLDQAFERDCALLRRRLRTAVDRPEVREAIFVAAPNISLRLHLWTDDPASKRGRKIEQVLVRYFSRMAGRATPFGLFAGVAVGALGAQTRLHLTGRAQYQRHTRFDMNFLTMLTEALVKDPVLRKQLSYRPNSSLYRAAGRVRYVEARTDGGERTYHLVSVEDTGHLKKALKRAGKGARIEEVAGAVSSKRISMSAAENFVEELVASQILVPELAPFLTGSEPTGPLIEELRAHGAREVAEQLGRALEALEAMDPAGVGVSLEQYDGVTGLVGGLSTVANTSRLFQVDMIKPFAEGSLGGAVLEEIVRGMEILYRLSDQREHASLREFKAAFEQRYGRQEVPLLEALDEESGVGFGAATGQMADPSPLLQGLEFPPREEEISVGAGRYLKLLRKLSDALQMGAREVALEARDLAALATKELAPLPDSFEVTAIVAASSQAALDDGDFRVVLRGASGPSGACLLGRFCHADEELRRYVREHLREGESLRPGTIFAEIVHLPQGTLGNVISRPVLRDYEIPYLGRSGAPADRQIPVTDLLVSVRDGTIRLRSARLGREVVPRMTNAHNFNWNSLGVYEFLCSLQRWSVYDWDWGPLSGAPFLPRLTCGRLVLSLARWQANRDELLTLSQRQGADRFRAVQTWRKARGLPRYITLSDGDNQLPVDLDNALSIESFVELLKNAAGALLFELYPAPEQLFAHGPEGKFIHELVVPFVNRKGAHSRREDLPAGIVAREPMRAALRRFPPGSKWLFLKLYTGAATADHVLRDAWGPLVRRLVRDGSIQQWFFTRYADPEWHLRLRFRGDPEGLSAAVRPMLEAMASVLLDDGLIWRAQFDTYEQEVERYGGVEGIKLAEQVFNADSEAVLTILGMLEPGDAGADERWRLAFRGVDSLFDDFGLDLETRRLLMKQQRQAYAADFREDKKLREQMSDKYRRERMSLEALLNPRRDDESHLGPGLKILRSRSAQLAPTISELCAHERAGRLTSSLDEIVISHIHMHLNRLLQSNQPAQEFVIYDFLARLYDARTARME